MRQLCLNGQLYLVREIKGAGDRLGLEAIDPETERRVSVITWKRFTGEISWVSTYCEAFMAHHEYPVKPHTCYRRRGLATALLKLARMLYPEPYIHHAPDRTDSAEAWAMTLNEPLPPRSHDHVGRGSRDVFDVLSEAALCLSSS